MGKILFYKSEGKNRIVVENEREEIGISIGWLLSEIEGADYIFFLNNRKSEDYNYVLKDNDLLYIFQKRNN